MVWSLQSPLLSTPLLQLRGSFSFFLMLLAGMTVGQWAKHSAAHRPSLLVVFGGASGVWPSLTRFWGFSSLMCRDSASAVQCIHGMWSDQSQLHWPGCTTLEDFLVHPRTGRCNTALNSALLRSNPSGSTVADPPVEQLDFRILNVHCNGSFSLSDDLNLSGSAPIC